MNKQSGFGIASMVIGIISLVFSCFGVGFLGALGFIFAIAAFMQRDIGKGTAIAGLTTSVIAFLISFFVVVVGISMFSYDGDNNKKSIVDENKKESADVIITDFTFDELELYNKKGIVIKATGNKSDEEPKIGIYVENSSKTDINISVGGMAVNNICCEDNWTYEEIMGGNKSNFTIDIDSDWADNNNITSIKKIDVLFDITSDNEDFESFSITKTVKTNNDDSKYQKTRGHSIYSDKNIDVIYLESDGSDYKFAIYSKFKKYLDYRIDRCSVNGYSYDLTDNDTQVYDESLFPGTYSIFRISVSDDFCDKNSIKDVEKIEFKISADSETTTTRLTGKGDISSKKIVFNVKKL